MFGDYLNGMLGARRRVTFSLTFYRGDSKWQSKTGTAKLKGVPSFREFVCYKLEMILSRWP